MKFLLMQFLVTIGILNFFNGVGKHIELNGTESSTSSLARRSGDSMGGRTGGCGKC